MEEKVVFIGLEVEAFRVGYKQVHPLMGVKHCLEYFLEYCPANLCFIEPTGEKRECRVTMDLVRISDLSHRNLNDDSRQE